MAALDQLCRGLWALLCNRGATHSQAVAAWLCPATRRRNYNARLRAPRMTARKRPAKQETTPGRTGTNTRPHTCRNISATQAPQASTSPSPRLGVQRSTQLPFAVAATFRTAVSEPTLSPAGGTDPQHRGATEDAGHLPGNAIKASRMGIG
ncbi:Hypothetical predicted protein [Pelobates cultripes]|uniref:Uncharacterized protein n=1 Tax=Pelobates cultripes TaxID=61616 RepID=A0AAD1WI45_PELCU|nr:Hypothetical predicted protein [Pelobates cultripes]